MIHVVNGNSSRRKATAIPNMSQKSWKMADSDEFGRQNDFTHALSCIYVTAKAVHPNVQDAWDQYLI